MILIAFGMLMIYNIVSVGTVHRVFVGDCISKTVDMILISVVVTRVFVFTLASVQVVVVVMLTVVVMVVVMLTVAVMV